MTFLQNTFEGGTNGVTLTTANSGGASGDAFLDIDTQSGLGIITYANTPMHGTMAVRSYGASNRAFFGWNGITAHSLFSTRFYLRIPSNPSAETSIFTVRNATVGITGLNLTTTRTLRLTNPAGTAIYTSSALALDTWYRVAIRGEVGTTTSNGKVWFDVYLGDTSTSLGSYNSTTADLGTTSLTTVRYGKQGATNTLDSLWDSISYDSTTSALIGIYVATSGVVRPSALDSNPGVWTNVGGSSIEGDLADESTATYAQSPSSPANAAFTVSLGGALTAGAVTVTTTAGADTASPATTLKVELLQGATVIATRTFNLTVGMSDYSFTTTSAETAAITDRTILKVRNTANQP